MLELRRRRAQVHGLSQAPSHVLLLPLWPEGVFLAELSNLCFQSGKRASEESPVAEGTVSSPNFYNPSDFPELSQTYSIIANIEGDNRPHATITVLGKQLTGLLDSGANCSLLGGTQLGIVEELLLKKGTVRGGVQTADGTKHIITEFVNLPIAYNGRNEMLPMLLVPSMPSCVILGMDFWEKFGVKAVCSALEMLSAGEEGRPQEPMKPLTEDQQRSLDKVVSLFPTSEDGKIGRTSLYEHRIDVGDAKPKKQRIYHVSKYVLDEVNKEVDRMIALDVIEEAMFSPWNNPLVAVKKKTGKYRVCLDARYLNSIMVNEGHPIQQISSIISNLSGCSYISSIDLKDAFWQLPLEEASRPLTAFTVPGRGHFQFKVVPFGLCTASQALSRLMTNLFADLEPRVFHYLDDVIICSRTFEEHLELLTEVATRLRRANLTVSQEKSKFCRKEMRYLGYVLNENGWKVDEDKISCIVKFPTPQSRKEVQRFLGMCNWYRRFIANFAEIAVPLTELTKVKIKFRWTSKAEDSFVKLKSMLVSAPVLAMPDYSRPFSIACDASDIAIGAVLTQDFDGEEHPIGYFSQKLSASERNYSVTERECLAVIRAIEKFRGYVEGVRFTVFCDHAALSYLRSIKNPTALMCRWILRLNAFDFDIKYRKGSCNVVPDALSRIVASTVFAQDQSEDSWYARLRKNVEKQPDKFPDFRMVNGEVFKNCRGTDELGNTGHKWKKVVPLKERAEVMSRFHDSATGAHLGFQKTWHKIQSHFYWPKMRQDIGRHVRTCTTCKASKAANTTMMPTMGKAKPAKVPWELVSIDFVGPLARSKAGNTVMLVVVDWVTKYVVAHPMRSADSVKMVHFLENEIFLRFSRPRIVLTDNGKQFMSAAFRSLLARHRIEHMTTAYYCPMVNNAERVNRVLITCIRALLEDDHRAWDENLPGILAAINSAQHESTGVSPHFANFGRNLILHTDLYKQQDLNVPNDPKLAQDLRLSTLKRVHEFVLKRIKASHEKSKQHYNLRARNVSFKVGDVVWRRNFGLSSKVNCVNQKLNPKFTAAIVREILGHNMYELEDVSTGKRGKYHGKDIKAD